MASGSAPDGSTRGARGTRCSCLPLLAETAEVRSTCPVTGTVVELVVAPHAVTTAPADLQVSFPPLAATDTADIIASFCCHVFFLAGADAERTWRATRAEDSVFDVDAAFELGRHAVAALLEPGSQRSWT